MLRRILLASLLPIFFTTAAFAADATFDRTLIVSAAPALSIATGSGYIHIYPGTGDAVHIIGHVHASQSWFGHDPTDRIRAIVASPPITQNGSMVKIGHDNSNPELFRNITIDYDVTAPPQTTLKASSGSGSLEIGGMIGSIEARCGSGSIHADNVGGNSRFSTGSGSIRADHVHGAATVDTGSGHIELSLTAPGDVEARTGSGGINLSGIQGGLHATTGSGSISVQGNPTQDWRLRSGSGSVHVTLDPAARFKLEASTGSGGILLKRPVLMQGSINRFHVTATANGGGPTVSASTGSGSVTID